MLRATLLSQVDYDRPDPGLARGKFAAPRWAIGLIGVAIVIGTLVYLVMRARRRRRG